MNVLTRGIMKNGTKIQIEDWSKDYPNRPFTLATYPLSKKSFKGQFSPKEDETWRFQFSFKSLEEVKDAFNELLNGNKELLDYKDMFSSKKEFLSCI